MRLRVSDTSSGIPGKILEAMDGDGELVEIFVE